MAQESWKIDKDETDCELLKPPSSSAAPVPAPPPLPAPAPPPSPAMCSKSPPPPAHQVAGRTGTTGTPREQAPAKVERLKAARCMNRCTSCRKKVGLTGFRCRCGELFCGRHRYSDTHDCSFDYKAAGREAIAKANPVIRAAKIIKI